MVAQVAAERRPAMAQMQQTMRQVPPVLWIAIIVAAIAVSVVGTLAVTKSGDTAVPSISLPSGSSAGSSQIELPVYGAPLQKQATPVFKGRTAPSSSFPFSDEEYIAAGKQALSDPDTRGMREVDISIRGWGHLSPPAPVSINVTPVRVSEDDTSLVVFYAVTLPDGRTFPRFVTAIFREGAKETYLVKIPMINSLPD